jgi:hypothetical protein
MGKRDMKVDEVGIGVGIGVGRCGARKKNMALVHTSAF